MFGSWSEEQAGFLSPAAGASQHVNVKAPKKPPFPILIARIRIEIEKLFISRCLTFELYEVIHEVAV